MLGEPLANGPNKSYDLRKPLNNGPNKSHDLRELGSNTI